MSNGTIRRACEMMRKPGTSLADLRKFLCPFGDNPEDDGCVVREAWHIAKRLAAQPQQARETVTVTSGRIFKGFVTPPREEVKPARKPSRADRRNAAFARKPKGNTTPAERLAIWALARAERAEKAKAA